MSEFKVFMETRVCQCVIVEAESAAEARDAAHEEVLPLMDPNVEVDGWEVRSVVDEDGNECE